jgi:hypothetical protein
MRLLRMRRREKTDRDERLRNSYTLPTLLASALHNAVTLPQICAVVSETRLGTP